MEKIVRRIKSKAEKTDPFREGESKKEVIQKKDEGGQPMDAARYYQLGKEYMEKGEFFKAIDVLEEAIGLDPHCIEACLKAGNCYEKLKKYEKALAYYEKALELDPDSTEIRYSLGVSLQLLGLPQEAEKEYLKVLASDGNHQMARNNLAAVYLKVGKREKAIEEFKKLVKNDSRNPAFQSNLKIASGESPGNRKQGKRTREGISLCMVIGQEEKEMEGFLGLVAPWVDEIIIVDTGSGVDRAKLAGDFGAKVVSHPWEEDLSAARNVSLKHASCEWILVLDTDEHINKDGFTYLRSLIKSQDYEGFSFIQRNYRDNPGQSGWVPCTDKLKQAWNCCGWIPSGPVKLFRNHEEIFFEGIINESVQRSIHRREGKIGSTAVLVHHLEYFLNHQNGDACEKRLLELGKKQRALTPDDSGVYYDLALRYARLNELDQAVATFRELMRLAPDSFSVCNDLGNIYFEKKEFGKAKDFYQRSLSIEPHFFQAHYNLANLHLLAGELDKSWAAYHRALEIYPECAQIYSNLGVICEKRGEGEEGLKHCEHAISLNPFLPQVYNNLGVLYNKKGDRLKAEENFLKAISFNDRYVEAYCNLGTLHLIEGKKDKAEEMFEEAYKYNPGLAEQHSVGAF
jgi:tetratricopeptide (TPR) repeat protein